jgi:hypothetical protein
VGAFIQGDVAAAFRASMEGAIGEAPTEEEVDEFIGDFEALMKPVMEPGKFAGWISPPKVGIDNKPGDFEYVKIAA